MSPSLASDMVSSCSLGGDGSLGRDSMGRRATCLRKKGFAALHVFELPEGSPSVRLRAFAALCAARLRRNHTKGHYLRRHVPRPCGFLNRGSAGRAG